MHSLIVFAIACAAVAHARPSEIILKGPSGIITKDGPIGPTGPATGGWEGDWKGEGGDWKGEGGWGGEEWDDGDDGSYKGEGAWEGGYVAPVSYGYAPVAPSWGGYSGGYGKAGVVIKGPGTVPALIVGPAGKVSADGLYGVPVKKWY